MQKLTQIATASLVAQGAMAAHTHAQSVNSVTIYGEVDQYLDCIKSSSGAPSELLQDGLYAHSRQGGRSPAE